MAHSKSAKKRILQNTKRRLANRRRKAVVKDGVRTFTEAVSAGQTDRAGELLKEVYRQLDKTTAKGTIHKNAAARKKSRLARRLGKPTEK